MKVGFIWRIHCLKESIEFWILIMESYNVFSKFSCNTKLRTALIDFQSFVCIVQHIILLKMWDYTCF